MQRKKLEGNGLWESSRMMLPQHTQRILEHQRETLRREKPVLDAQEWDLIDQALYHSMADHAPVTLTLFDPFVDRQAKGIVMKVDRQLKRIKLRWSEDDWDWVDMSEIIAATT
ncbi:YolD-like family protein [Paenibacillus zanthoxyli]|uniref:YolD-like family protein n=1 Tax=Paenibacillus zanthoxyli TaxID=369399 RepID=UPI00046FFDC4|nr:YolD-like family protein [Paenibacillus zanthoxyli]